MNKQIIHDLEVAHLLSSSLSTRSLVELEIFVRVGFDESGKPDYPERKPLRAKKRTNKKFTQPMVSTPGFERGPQFGGGE